MLRLYPSFRTPERAEESPKPSMTFIHCWKILIKPCPLSSTQLTEYPSIQSKHINQPALIPVLRVEPPTRVLIGVNELRQPDEVISQGFSSDIYSHALAALTSSLPTMKYP